MEGETFGGEKYESARDLLQKEVANYRKLVDEEFHRGSGNTWPSCIISRLAAMNAFLDIAEEEGDVSTEEASGLRQKLKKANTYATEMQRKYTTVDAQIPSQEKEEMLSMLDLFSA